MEAKIRRDYIKVVSFYEIGRTSIIETRCPDYDTFSNLPDVIEFDNSLHVLTGWNSDYGLAYYKTNGHLAKGARHDQNQESF